MAASRCLLDIKEILIHTIGIHENRVVGNIQASVNGSSRVAGRAITFLNKLFIFEATEFASKGGVIVRMLAEGGGKADWFLLHDKVTKMGEKIITGHFLVKKEKEMNKVREISRMKEVSNEAQLREFQSHPKLPFPGR
jgi:hypothetical protein